MIIRCWGARGSIAVSGRDYIRYGGDTTCLEIRTRNDEIIIIDAGTGIRRLGGTLLRESRSHVHMLFTHAHWDHLTGFPFFKPLYDRNHQIIIHGNPVPGHLMKDILSSLMSPPVFPVSYRVIAPRLEFREYDSQSFSIDSVTVVPFNLSHPGGGKGYLFNEEGKTFVFITDNELSYTHSGGLTFQDYREICAGADLLIHDAEFTQAEGKLTHRWGHSLYRDALNLALEAKVKNFGLFHHNQDRSDEAIDAIVNDCENIILAEGSSMNCFALFQEWELYL